MLYSAFLMHRNSTIVRLQKDHITRRNRTRASAWTLKPSGSHFGLDTPVDWAGTLAVAIGFSLALVLFGAGLAPDWLDHRTLAAIAGTTALLYLGLALNATRLRDAAIGLATTALSFTLAVISLDAATGWLAAAWAVHGFGATAMRVSSVAPGMPGRHLAPAWAALSITLAATLVLG
ncbi:MAG: hypothetical protein KDG50_06505 [Chromatiales bacterium]|nr:hypothetical protein [Chromatiales bacterium]